MDANGKLHVYRGGNLVTFQQDGNVGIGYATPGYSLAIAGDFFVRDALTAGSGFSYNDTTRLLTLTNSGNAGGINLVTANARIYFGGTRAIEGTPGNASGNLTFGEGYTSGKVRLIAGTTEVTNIMNLSGVNKIHQLSGHNFVQGDATMTYLYGGSGGGQIRTTNNASSLVQWLDNGNVGIGTTAPSEKLDVNGGSLLVDAFNAGAENGIYFRRGFGSASSWKYNISILAYDHGGGNLDGISINAYDGISFCTNSNTRNERMRVDQDGNVGIGITDPLQLLHVHKASGDAAAKISCSGHARLILATTGTTDHASVDFGDSGGDVRGRILYANTGDYMKFETNGSERMRITSDGTLDLISAKFKINGSGGTNGYTIVTDGSGNISWSSAGTGTVTGSGTDNYVPRWNGTTALQNSALFSNDNGNVGIGTTVPECKLDIHDHTSATTFIADNNAGVRITNWGGSTGWSLLGFGGFSTSYEKNLAQIGSLSSNAGTYLAFGTSNSYSAGITNQAMTIDPSGKVGIGTTAPARKLEVYGDTSDWCANFRCPTDGYGVTIGNRLAAGTGYAAHLYWSGGDAGSFTIQPYSYTNSNARSLVLCPSGGNVGIGTATPAHALHVYDTTGNASAVLIDGSASNSGFLSFRQSGVEKAYIQYTSNSYLRYFAAGGHNFAQNVGINKTVPDSWLHIEDDNSLTKHLLHIKGGGASGAYGVLVEAANGNDLFKIDTLSYKVTMPSGYPVGIGTTTPGTLLSLFDTGSTSAVQEFIRLENKALGGTGAGSSINFHHYHAGSGPAGGAKAATIASVNSQNWAAGTPSSYSTDLAFSTLNENTFAERVRIASDGKVGIGTATPAVKLHLDSGATTELRIDGEGHELITFHKSSAQKGLVGYSIGDSTLKLCAGSGTIASNVNGISINANGNVGIGTNGPTQKLHVFGNFLFGSNSKIGFNNDINSFVIDGGGTYGIEIDGWYGASLQARSVIGVFVDELGNVGIGPTATNPDATGSKLQISSGTTANAANKFYDLLKLKGKNNTLNAVGMLFSIESTAGAAAGLDYSKGGIVYGPTSGWGRGAMHFLQEASNTTADADISDSVMTILNDGNVGIGATDPEKRLEVKSDTTYDGILIDVLSAPEIIFRDRGNSDTKIGTGRHGLDDFYIDTYSGNAFAIDGATRNVGIGLIDPAACRLNVLTNINNNVAAQFENSHATGSYGVVIKAGDDSGNYALSVRNKSNGHLMQVNGDGNVGIGTNAPASNLHVTGTGGPTPLLRLTGSASDSFNWISTGLHANLAAGETNIHIFGKAETVKNSGWIGYQWNGDASDTNLVTIGHYGANHLFTVAGSGNVGIGTTSPAAMLEVIARASGGHPPLFLRRGATNESASLKLLTTTTEDWIVGMRNDGTSNFRIYSYGTSSDVFSILRSNGNVGIGITAPGAKLHVAGTTGTILILDNEATAHEQAPHIELRAGPGGSVYGDNWIRFVDESESKSWALGMDDDLNIFSLTHATSKTAGPTASAAISVKEDGNVGIGTTGPTAPLDFGVTSTNSRVLHLRQNGNSKTGFGISNNYGVRAFGPSDASATGALFEVGEMSGTTFLGGLFTVTYEGKVGIGTTAPSAVLDVRNGTVTQNAIYAQSDSSYGSPLYLNDVRSDTSMEFLAQFKRNNVLVGHIASDATQLRIGAPAGYVILDGADGTILRDSGTNKIIQNGSYFRPDANNNMYLGASAQRWAQVYSVLGNFSGTVTVNDRINTSSAVGFNNAPVANMAYIFGGGSTSDDPWGILFQTTSTQSANRADLVTRYYFGGTHNTNGKDVTSIATTKIVEPNLTNVTGTITNSYNLIIGAAATEATNNYSLLCEGKAAFSGTIVQPGNGGTIDLGSADVGNGSPSIRFIGSNTTYNWRFRQNDNNGGDFTIKRSTAGGGTTFESVPTLQFLSDHQAIFRGALTASAGLASHSAVGNAANGSWDSAMHSLQIAHSMSLFCETANGADRNSVVGSNVYYNSGYKRMYTDETCSILLRSNYISFRTDNSGTANVTFTPSEVAKISPGVLTMTGDVTPSADATYDLGHTSSLDWNVLYIRTIDMFNQRLMLSTSAEMVTFKDHVSVGQGTQFYARNTAVMRVGDASGNARVGIGTSSPATTLTVEQRADSSGIRLYGYDDKSASYMDFSVNSAGHTNLTTSGGSYTKFDMGSGYFMLNTAANEPIYFDFGGTFFWRDVDASNAVRMQLDSSSGNLAVTGNVTISNDKILSVGTTNGNSGAIRLYDGSSTSRFMDWEAVGTTTAWYRFNGGTSYTSPYRTYFNQQHPSAGHNLYVDGDITSMGTGRYIYAENLNVSSYKNFEIEHPTKENMMLVHSSLEGPEAGVYYRGRAQSDTITLPDYWTGLVRDGTITVQLTPNGSFQHLYVVSTSLTEIKIGAAEGETIDCYYVIYGERADVASLVVEDADAWHRFQERKAAMSDGKA